MGSGNTELTFVQIDSPLPHVPGQFVFPPSGDLRRRPFRASGHVTYSPMLQLRNSARASLGDAVVYARPKDGGHVAYAWFGRFNTPQAEPILYDLFTFLADQLSR